MLSLLAGNDAEAFLALCEKPKEMWRVAGAEAFSSGISATSPKRLDGLRWMGLTHTQSS